jgi:riboflavin kinase/FMN adenylyltransferase
MAVRVFGIEPKPMTAVASLGTRPTVDGTDMLLEVHVFDFAGELYGREIEVEFVAKLRDEVKFDSLQSLAEQMRVDAAQARGLLSKVNSD